MIPELELLARLRDVHAPSAPSWWPPAPGWWAALLLAVLLAAIAIRYGPPWWRRRRLRRRVLAALEPAATAAQISQLLRVAVLERFPHRGVEGLHGADWIAFLEACERTPGRFAAVRETLTEAPYAPLGAGADAAPLLRAARGWLRAVL